MAVTDYNKRKKLDVTSQNDSASIIPDDWSEENTASVTDDSGSNPTIQKVQPIIITEGTGSGSGDAQFSTSTWDEIVGLSNSNEGIVVTDTDNVPIPYEIESLDTSNRTAVVWAYKSYDRDNTDQLKIVGGTGDGTDYSMQDPSVETKNGDSALKVETDGNGSSDYQVIENTDFNGWSQGDTMDTWIYAEDHGEPQTYYQLRNSDGSNYAGLLIRPYSGQDNSVRFLGSASSDGNLCTGCISRGNWYRLEFEHNGTNTIGRVYDIDGNELGSHTHSTDPDNVDQKAMVWSLDKSTPTTVWIDDISTTPSSSDGFEDGDYTSNPSWTVTEDTNGEFSVQTGAGVGENPWDQAGVNAEMVQHLQDDPLTATDSSPKGNDGTVNGASATTGEFGGAASFDGTDDNIEVGDIGITDSVTIAGWFESISPAFSALVNNYENTNGEYYMLRQESDKTNAYRFAVDDGSTNTRVGTQNDLGSGIHSVIGTYDSSDGSMALYTNGDTDDTTTHSGSVPSTDQNWTLGAQSNNSGGSGYAHDDWFYNGVMDALRVYSAVKSSSWAQAEYDASPKAGQTFFSWSGPQSTASGGTVSGTVTDTSGSAVSNAEIYVVNSDDNTVIEKVTTDANGNYETSEIEAGTNIHLAAQNPSNEDQKALSLPFITVEAE